LWKSECLGSDPKLDPKLFTKYLGSGSVTIFFGSGSHFPPSFGSGSETNSYGSTTLLQCTVYTIYRVLWFWPCWSTGMLPRRSTSCLSSGAGPRPGTSLGQERTSFEKTMQDYTDKLLEMQYWTWRQKEMLRMMTCKVGWSNIVFLPWEEYRYRCKKSFSVETLSMYC
jgi:hypothetical protein